MKKSLRQAALAHRNHLAPCEIREFSQVISASLRTLLQSLQPCTVGLFYPVRSEPDVLSIMDSAGLEGFKWALPVCCESPEGSILRFAQYKPADELVSGAYDIPCPKNQTWVKPALLVIPCLAFHSGGARLGYGAGWYDRTLSRTLPVPMTVGVAYSVTESKENFREAHDHLLDFVITERGVITTHPNES